MNQNTMTPRERVYRSIRHQPSDIVPWQMDLTRGVEKGLRQHYGADDLITATGDHIVWVKPLLPPALADPTLEPGLVKGEFGDIWRMRDEAGQLGRVGEYAHPGAFAGDTTASPIPPCREGSTTCPASAPNTPTASCWSAWAGCSSAPGACAAGSSGTSTTWPPKLSLSKS